MSVFKKKHIFVLLPLALAVEITLLSLAGWQWGRYQQRNEERASQSARPTQTRSGTFRPVTFALDNQPGPAGGIGWRLLSPFDTQTGPLIVDRGWLPLPADRTAAPDFTPVMPPQGQVTLTGIAQPIKPRKGWLQGPDTTTSPQVLARLNPALIISPTAAEYLQLTQALPGQNPLLKTQAAPTPEPLNHLSYALQWLGMATAFPLLCLFAWRKTRRGSRR